MKKTTIAGAMLATAVALAFTGSVLNAEDTPGASARRDLRRPSAHPGSRALWLVGSVALRRRTLATEGGTSS